MIKFEKKNNLSKLTSADYFNSVHSKDVRLPTQLQRAMAAEAEAAREARAKVIAAEGEMKASRALKEASDVIIESPAALQVCTVAIYRLIFLITVYLTLRLMFQLRYLQTLNTISAEKNSTIIFPLPIDLLSAFMPHLRENKNKDTK